MWTDLNINRFNHTIKGQRSRSEGKKDMRSGF